MIKKLFLLCVATTFSFWSLNAQTVEELKAAKAEKTAAIGKLQSEADALQTQIDAFPGWKIGAIGTIGFNANGFNKWLGQANPNSFSSTIGFAANAFANLDREKFFWRSRGSLTLGWTKLDLNTKIKEEGEDNKYQETADAINLSSLYGYKLNDKWAISGLAEYRSTVLNNFNNPGFLDVGVGVTWTPISSLVVVIHPLNYNLVFSDSKFTYESSLGAKVVADYSQSLPMGVAWRSNLSGFLSYSDPANYSNWTWVNGFSFTAWKGIGVGIEFGLRHNKQESYNALLTGSELTSKDFKIDQLDALGDALGVKKADINPIQSYWLLGLTYTL